MRRLSTADLERTLGLVRDWHEAGSTDELVTLAIVGLRGLVACDAVGWNEIDLAGKRVRAVLDPADFFSESMLETLARLIDQNPIVGHYASTGNGSAVAISDFLGVRAYRRRELYCELYRTLGVEDQLAFVVEVGAIVTGVAFNRATRSFSERDRAVLDLLRPHLASARANLQVRAVAQERLEALERGLEEDGRGVIVLRNGRAEAVSAEGVRLLSRWFGSSPPPLPALGTPLVIERDEARLTVRRIAGDTPMLLLDETRFTADPERARALGLTRRQTEVLALAARGLTDTEIATQLFVGVRTVQKHLEHAYRTLGVNTRREAVTRLLSR